MKNQLELTGSEKSMIENIRVKNIIDMGLAFSAMMRLFEEEKSKKKLNKKIFKNTLGEVFSAKSKKDFDCIHSRFCCWGIKKISLSEKRSDTQGSNRPSYGQIAKTFDVVMKVAIYYCRLPDCEKSKEILPWLNAAVDTNMMKMLRKCYPKDIEPWPRTIKGVVCKQTYEDIQSTVRKFIRDKHNDSIMPVQFDDIYWKVLKELSK